MKIFHKIKNPTPQNRKEFFSVLQTMIGELIKKAGGRKNIKGIGCGLPGALDLKRGIVLHATNIRILNGFNIKNWLTKKFNYSVRIDNDARCFTRGEYLWGAGKNYQNIIGMTLGTGIGGGIIINGKMFYGNGSAGEVGHMINGEMYLEDLAIKDIKNFGFSDPLEAYEFARKGNKKAKEAFNKMSKHLGIGIANLVNILDPEAIVIGGGIAGASKFFLPKTKQIMEKFIVSPKSRKNVKIIIGNLGENAGAIGAAALFLE